MTRPQPVHLDGRGSEAPTDGLPLVASFDDGRRAARAARALRTELGTGHVWLLRPPRVNWFDLRAQAHHASDGAVATELGRALVDERYGAGDATWAEYEPVYQFAWDLAHAARYRGRPWGEVATRVRRAWRECGTGPDWEQVADGVSDVWQDVTDDVEGCPPDRAPAALH